MSLTHAVLYIICFILIVGLTVFCGWKRTVEYIVFGIIFSFINELWESLWESIK